MSNVLEELFLFKQLDAIRILESHYLQKEVIKTHKNVIILQISWKNTDFVILDWVVLFSVDQKDDP